MKDVSFIEEVIQLRDRLLLIDEQLNRADSSDVDIVEYAIVVAKLELKMEILSALSMSNDTEGEDTFSFNLLGMNKSITIDIAKLKEAITIGDNTVQERDAIVSKKVNFEEIPEGVDETAILDIVRQQVTDIDTKDLIGPKATAILPKDSFIKIFKYTNDLARFLQNVEDKNSKLEAQEARLPFFGSEDEDAASKYVECI